jgi:hypothetical protein
MLLIAQALPPSQNGCRFPVLGGGDLGFMAAAATERAKLLRDCR